jgi:integrase
VSVYKRERSPFYQYDFEWNGSRYRGSTKQSTENKARIFEAALMTQLREEGILVKKSPILENFSPTFLKWVEDSQQIKECTRKYYRQGWNLLARTKLKQMQMDQIRDKHVEVTIFSAGPSNANCAIRTLRRMLGKAHDDGLVAKCPKLHLRDETKRSLLMDDASEAKVLPMLSENAADVIVITRDSGMRNHSEVCRMRWEYVNWEWSCYTNPDGKTEAAGRTGIPLSNRVLDILNRRHLKQGMPAAGWIFPSRRSKTGHLTTVNSVFRKARRKAGLPEALVPYCGRHDFGTTAMVATGDPKLVGALMGHRDTKTTMRYNHPPKEQVERIRAVLNTRRAATQLRHTATLDEMAVTVIN